MNTNWLKLSKERRIEILNQATELTGLPAIAIEKDWWVTLCLNASFSLPYSNQLVFKGGTSLSKGWDLIERFSEDIDLAIDRKFFRFEGDISNTQIRKLRKQSCEFISTEFLKDLTQTLTDWGATTECELFAQPIKDSDKDPQVIEIHYNSVADTSEYLPQRVLIEISSRSLMEPTEKREINSILNVNFPKLDFATDTFTIPTVLPQRTFLEKTFLLHEEFSQEPEKIRIDRLSRHFYDFFRLLNSEIKEKALVETALLERVAIHKSIYFASSWANYGTARKKTLKLFPPPRILKELEKDYHLMEAMFFREVPDWEVILKTIENFEKEFNDLDGVGKGKVGSYD